MLLTLIWLIVVPQARGSASGRRSAPALSHGFGKGSCEDPDLPTSHLQLDF